VLCIGAELIIMAELKVHDTPMMHTIETWLKIISLAILSIFVIEIIFKIAFAKKEFLHSKLEVFDGFIVVSSFILDIIFFKQVSLDVLLHRVNMF
jgi:hypothetical protein